MDTSLMVCAGLALAIIFYGIKGPLPPSGSLKGWWCPSIVSLLATFICLGSYFIGWILLGQLAVLVSLYCLGAILDTVDGRLARQWDKDNGKTPPQGGWFFHPGTSDQGALWDSSNDKVRIILIYLHSGVACSDGVISTLFLMIALTELMAGTERLLAFRKRRANGGNHSTWIGKVKTWAQQLCLILWVFHGVFGQTALLLGLGIVFSLTVMSPVSRVIRRLFQGTRKM